MLDDRRGRHLGHGQQRVVLHQQNEQLRLLVDVWRRASSEDKVDASAGSSQAEQDATWLV
jgi:hypothetical protein